METESLLSIRDVAARLGISLRATYYLVEDGTLPHFRVGPRRIRFSPQQIDAYLRSVERKGNGTRAVA